ncbi:hypothetical protein JMN32_03425 [Fulvivirga sp. 29W222]|uniref:Uncharacterized protein n=1 Tax=Fulvivirga marina TaxID=2494733 RepID=A0A937FVP2_9BACT|nr:hypothetical protein [Fulvivirga marina]MBL6445343.1 hypothetical protein [Fulvivirga marina]
MVKGGKYIGNPDWPKQLEGLKSGKTSGNRLIFSIGGWSNNCNISDFANIKNLIDKYDISSYNALYENLKVLKETIPGIYFIDFE